MNPNIQIKTVREMIAVFTKYNISKLDAIAIMEVIKYDLLRQSSTSISKETDIPQHGDIA